MLTEQQRKEIATKIRDLLIATGDNEILRNGPYFKLQIMDGRGYTVIMSREAGLTTTNTAASHPIITAPFHVVQVDQSEVPTEIISIPPTTNEL